MEETLLSKDFVDPLVVAILLRDQATAAIVGFTYAMPIGDMDKNRDNESEETAYIGATILHHSYRGHHLVGDMIGSLETELRNRGFEFIERDAVVNHDYAAKIERHYGDRIVKKSKPHKSKYGPQVFFKICL